MYIDGLELKNVRTFTDSVMHFVHPDKAFRNGKVENGRAPKLLPKPKLPNVNLLLGENGSGKTTVLQAIAAAAFGPAARDILRDPTFVRFGTETADVHSKLLLHEQDRANGREVDSNLRVHRKGERLIIASELGRADPLWEPVYESKNEAFFVVGYGATRRVERLDVYDPGARVKSRSPRDLRVLSLFEPSFSLIPLAGWLPSLKKENHGRYIQVVHLLDTLLNPGEFSFTREQDERGEYLFQRGNTPVPFQALSDGYRGFIGWVGDLLHHVCFGCPPGRKLADSSGIVLVDEIDLLLHPRWQMKVIGSIAKALPRMQFILTSHSPLVAGSLEWMNIIMLEARAKANRTVVNPLTQSIHGLDADQILLTEFFGLKTTRAPGKVTQLENLQRKARHGDKAAARKIILAMAEGTEAAE